MEGGRRRGYQMRDTSGSVFSMCWTCVGGGESAFVGEELCGLVRAAHAWHVANKTNRETPPEAALGVRSPHTRAGLV